MLDSPSNQDGIKEGWKDGNVERQTARMDLTSMSEKSYNVSRLQQWDA